ncbi:acyl-CoA carboxylase epsilon subunit [Streptomyces sp. PT12]|uniref:acyl-CoA carboxylase epsilon subunit n=1 Tax=Streptomyces sp. PT12 TaxID=1510197 RepID=UPI000DE3943A|nr:acyl-CoA carboxylase epsilon subunit [Streptomyces sp. PT12]RBM11701.1 hypothetical protein DEH69_20550 [Streptomyces sp. PT12]
MIRVVRGNPTAEELAAALAVVQARAAAAAAAPPPPERPRSPWSSPAHNLPRALPAPGHTAWRTSYRRA